MESCLDPTTRLIVLLEKERERKEIFNYNICSFQTAQLREKSTKLSVPNCFANLTKTSLMYSPGMPKKQE